MNQLSTSTHHSNIVACHYCRTIRQYLSQLGIPYLDSTAQHECPAGWPPLLVWSRNWLSSSGLVFAQCAVALSLYSAATDEITNANHYYFYNYYYYLLIWPFLETATLCEWSSQCNWPTQCLSRVNSVSVNVQNKALTSVGEYNISLNQTPWLWSEIKSFIMINKKCNATLQGLVVRTRTKWPYCQVKKVAEGKRTKLVACVCVANKPPLKDCIFECSHTTPSNTGPNKCDYKTSSNFWC